MTVRAVIIGLILAAALASFGYANDVWFFFSYIGGDLLPTHAFGLLLLGLLVANPLLRWIGRWQVRSGEWVTILGMAFMGSVIAGSAYFWQMPHPIITPISEQANNPGWKDKNLLQYVPDIMMVDAKVPPGQALPPTVSDYINGMGKRGEMVPFGQVPWGAWAPTMTFWIALLGLSFVGGVAAVVVVHRQWSQREHLSYPIVTFTNELLEHEPGRTFNPIFRNPVFWIGFGVSFLVLAINGYQTWNTSFVSVPMSVSFGGLREIELLKELLKVPEANRLLTVQLFFSAVGLAYFLSNEVSFSLGISGWLYALAATPFVIAGVNMSGGMLEGSLPSHMWFGAYLGMGITTIYLGRRFYWAAGKRAYWLSCFTHMALYAGAGTFLWTRWWAKDLSAGGPWQWSSLWPLAYVLLGAMAVIAILRRRKVTPTMLGFLIGGAAYGAAGVIAWHAVWSRMSGGPLLAWLAAYLGVGLACWALARRFEEPKETGESEVLPREVWAARIGMFACIAMTLLLCTTGLHPLLSAAFVVLTGLLFLMLTRIHTATGLFLIQPLWHPVTVLLAVFGGFALGPQTLIILALLCTVITLDPRIAMMPLVANALKLGDKQDVKPGRLAGWLAVAIIFALAVGMIATVYLVYNRGVNGMDSPGTRWALDVAKMPFSMLETKVVTPLDSQGQLAAAAEPVTFERLLTKAKLTPNFLTAAAIGLGLVLVCSFLRLRFARWPLHPVMFLVWGQGWMMAYAPSFLLAWFLKTVIMQYGGQKSYYRARGFFVGLVAGEFTAALLWAVVGIVYYFQTGDVGKSFLVRP